jgi:hypothetical protein
MGKAGSFFLIFFCLLSIAAFAEPTVATLEHLKILRQMQRSFAKQPGGGGRAAVKIENEILRIQSEYNLGQDDLPMKARPEPMPQAKSQSEFRSGKQNYDRYGADDGSAFKAKHNEFYNSPETVKMREAALSFAKRSVGWGGLGQTEYPARQFVQWCVNQGYSPSQLEAYIETFERASSFARRALWSGGLEMEESRGILWAQDVAKKMSLTEIMEYEKKYLMVFEFAQKMPWSGGLGYSKVRASEWARENAKVSSVGEVKTWIESRRNAARERNSCSAIFRKVFGG